MRPESGSLLKALWTFYQLGKLAAARDTAYGAGSAAATPDFSLSGMNPAYQPTPYQPTLGTGFPGEAVMSRILAAQSGYPDAMPTQPAPYGDPYASMGGLDYGIPMPTQPGYAPQPGYSDPYAAMGGMDYGMAMPTQPAPYGDPYPPPSPGYGDPQGGYAPTHQYGTPGGPQYKVHFDPPVEQTQHNFVPLRSPGALIATSEVRTSYNMGYS